MLTAVAGPVPGLAAWEAGFTDGTSVLALLTVAVTDLEAAAVAAACGVTGEPVGATVGVTGGGVEGAKASSGGGYRRPKDDKDFLSSLR